MSGMNQYSGNGYGNLSLPLSSRKKKYISGGFAVNFVAGNYVLK